MLRLLLLMAALLSAPALAAPPPSYLVVAPTTGMSFGTAAVSYSLSSTRRPVGYTISGLPAWLSATLSSGVTPATVSFSPSSSAASMPPGTYTATISFRSSSGFGTTTRAATLTITAPPPMGRLVDNSGGYLLDLVGGYLLAQ